MDQAKLGAELIGPAVIPIFKSNDRLKPEFEGSGVLIRIAGRHFLLSAAHVFDRCNDEPFLLTSGNERVPTRNRPYKTALPLGRTRDDDKIDVGFLQLTEQEAAALGTDRFLSTRHINVHQAYGRHSQFFAFGYPGKMQERDDAKYMYLTAAAYYVSLEAEARGYQFCKLTRHSHLLLSYDTSKLVNMAGGGIPVFNGMSGGGVFAFNSLHETRADNPPRLVAITIEQPHCFGKAILTTRVDLALAGIRTACPDAAIEVPENRVAPPQVAFVPPAT